MWRLEVKNLYILALEGCVASAVLGLSEIFRLANRVALETDKAKAAPFNPILVGLTGDPVQTDDGMLLPVQRKLPRPQPDDFLLITGCMPQNLDLAFSVKQRTAEKKALQNWSAQKGNIAAQCSSVFLLAEAGLLAGHKATATWWAQDQLAASYPDITLSKEETLTDDGNIVCVAGPYSHLDLGLHLIERLSSRYLASLVAKFAMIERTPPSQSAFRTMDLVSKTPPIAKRVETFVLEHLPDMPEVGALAAHLGLTTRTLQRHLAEATNLTPKGFINDVRMNVAKRLIETSTTRVQDLMLATGFSDESAFRKQFRRASGMTPKQYADRYGANL
jgi:transcriptional regulator GlxA family with amidase domain